MNIIKQIEMQAETYRKKLGLRSWDDQQGWALREWDKRYQQGHDSKGDGPERQSGRTTRDILLTLAACEVTGIRDVVINAGRTLGTVWAARFEDFMDKLDLRVRLYERLSKVGRPFITYTDHHDG